MKHNFNLRPIGPDFASCLMMTRPHGATGDRCDCCSVKPAETFLACRNFNFQGKPVFAREPGRWAVCSGCQGLLLTHQWLRLSKCSKKNPELFRMLSRHIIPGEEIHCRDAEERAGLSRPTMPKGQLSPTDDSIDWLERLYALLDLREPIAAAV
jgi:hypothetical protein